MFGKHLQQISIEIKRNCVADEHGLGLDYGFPYILYDGFNMIYFNPTLFLMGKEAVIKYMKEYSFKMGYRVYNSFYIQPTVFNSDVYSANWHSFKINSILEFKSESTLKDNPLDNLLYASNELFKRFPEEFL